MNTRKKNFLIYLKKRLKNICGNNVTYLIPGIGTQGGDLAGVIESLGVVRKSKSFDYIPYIINSSRSIIYASTEENFQDEARKKALHFVESVKTKIFKLD